MPSVVTLKILGVSGCFSFSIRKNTVSIFCLLLHFDRAQRVLGLALRLVLDHLALVLFLPQIFTLQVLLLILHANFSHLFRNQIIW